MTILLKSLNMRIRHYLLLFLTAGMLFTSCSNFKKIPYLQDVEKISETDLESIRPVVYDARILPNDMLTITVNASEREAGLPFNLLYPTTSVTGGSSSGAQSLQKYLVDNEGYINFPTVGMIKLQGKTRREAESAILDKISSNFKEMPIVIVSFVDYKISVVGEVARPGTFRVDNEKVNVLQALALAGDMTIYGVRENVKIIREHADARKEVIPINLNDPYLIYSPNYYLQQNDILYVEPNKVKSKSSDIGTVTTLALSGVSTLISVTNLILNLTRR